MIFWCRRWMEHSRSPRPTTVPCASAKTCTSMWRPVGRYRSQKTRPSPNAACASRAAASIAAGRSFLLGHHPHSAAAATGGCLHQHRKVGHLARVGPGRQHRHPGLGEQCLRVHFGPHGRDRLRGRSDPGQSRIHDCGGEVGVLGQKAVAGVHRVGTGPQRARDDQLTVEIGVARCDRRAVVRQESASAT